MKLCQYTDELGGCDNLVQGTTDYCATHGRLLRKQEEDERKAQAMRKALLSKPKLKRKNTSLCSDGSRVTQDQIEEKLRRHYPLYKKQSECEGCGKAATSHAHIIPQARCKHIGKTELIWNRGNWFYGCFECNSAIENPKGEAWKNLRNIEDCLEFMAEHDPELFRKFEIEITDRNTKL